MDTMTDKNSRGTGSMTRAGSVVDDFIGDVRAQASDIKAQYIDRGWDKTRDMVRENPGKTLLITAGVGILLGALLARRR
jgi:ElaB/YqjD/DUF883 family membrane-anchored ribosome-binding protein